MIQVTASDADDPTYGNSAKLVYSILEGQPYFSVEAQTGTVNCRRDSRHTVDEEPGPARSPQLVPRSLRPGKGHLLGWVRIREAIHMPGIP